MEDPPHVRHWFVLTHISCIVMMYLHGILTHISWIVVMYLQGIPLLPLTHQSTSLDTHKASPNP